MNLQKLAESLGLPKDSPEATVFEALAKRDAEGRAAVVSLGKLTGQLPAIGLKLEADKLVRVEPLKLDIKPEDDDEKKELKKKLLEAEQDKLVAKLSADKGFVAKIAGDLKMPPAMIALAEEVLSVRGELEAVCLSKDGKGIELRKTADFPGKVKNLLEQLASFKGVKFADPKAGEPKTDEELAKAERAKLAEELVKKQEPTEEAAAAK